MVELRKCVLSEYVQVGMIPLVDMYVVNCTSGCEPMDVCSQLDACMGTEWYSS